MIEKRILLLLVFCTYSVFGQIKGIVIDSLSGQPVPFASVWIVDDNKGVTADENGTFSFNPEYKNRSAVVTAIGYEQKTFRVLESSEIRLRSKNFELKEMIISKWKETKQREIGETENSISQAFDNAPHIDLKYFPYTEAYKKTKFIKKVSLYTDCRIENVRLKLHFYAVDADGHPGEELLQQDYIVSVKKGVGKSNFNISELGLKMPINGIFVGFEKLMLERNRTDKKYYPLVLYDYVPKDFIFTYSGGKWEKQVIGKKDQNSSGKAYEPAINLTLTN
ncbi:carboxypeptidase-like regulatory domain-containing protein [Flavobacterium enshiense]|uniref:carboxypeptidase-like regulatory domain-containing protein n=1 Tax=Flavobacterium enshiense TaxID=1341165 RepID=UPI00345C761B